TKKTGGPVSYLYHIPLSGVAVGFCFQMEFPRPVFIEELECPVYVPVRHAFQTDSDALSDPEMDHCTEHQQFLFADPRNILVAHPTALDLILIDGDPYKQAMGCRDDGPVKFMAAVLLILNRPDKCGTGHFLLKKLYVSHVLQMFVHASVPPLMFVVIITPAFNIINNSKFCKY